MAGHIHCARPRDGIQMIGLRGQGQLPLSTRGRIERDKFVRLTIGNEQRASVIRDVQPMHLLTDGITTAQFAGLDVHRRDITGTRTGT